MCKLLEANVSTSEDGLKDIMRQYGVSDTVCSAIQEMGLFSDLEMAPLLHTPIDSLSAALAQKYTFS